MNEQQFPESAEKTERRRQPLWLLLLLDLVLAGVFLCVFALFHHVIPYWGGASAEPQEPIAIIQPPEPSPTPAPTPEPLDEPEPEPYRTDWQIQFADHFTKDVVVTDHSYSSPTVSVDITTHQEVINGYNQVWYVADIYVASVENFQTWAGEGSFTRMVQTPMEQIARETDSIICINGDYCNAQVQYGFYVRNGAVYNLTPTTCDICVLYYDGRMVTYSPRKYKVDDILAESPYQVWKFGPRLLDENGEPLSSFNTGEAVAIGNPRSAIGYYEPGHYCFVTVDGRHEEWSRGLTIEQFSQLFKDLGCKAAYNLDGGASATMAFMGNMFNRQSSKRDVGDVLLIKELPQEQPEVTP